MALQVEAKPTLRTLVDRDIELVTRLRRFDSSRSFLRENDHYTVTRYTEVSDLSECYVCNTGRRAQCRVTIRNDTLNEVFFCGLDCMEKYFDLRKSDLERTSLPLKQLASTWEAFRSAVEPDFSGFAGTSTGEAVKDMYNYFGEVPLLRQAQTVIGEMLANLRGVQDGGYSAEVGALRDLLGVLYEAANDPKRLQDRAVALKHHPLLEPQQKMMATQVLENVDRLLWRDFVDVSQLLGSIAGKRLSLRLKEVPVYEFENRLAYAEAVAAHARTRRDAIDDRHNFVPSEQFHRTITKGIEELAARKGGITTFAFDNSRLEPLERLSLNHEAKFLLKRTGVKVLEAYGASPYQQVVTRSEKTTLRSMFRESQLEEETEQRQTSSKPRSGYYRGFVLFLPDVCLPTYEVWARYGGSEVGRKNLESLVSSF